MSIRKKIDRTPRQKRADAIVDFIKSYPGNVLNFHRIEQMAGIGQGTLSRYEKKYYGSGIRPHRLKKIEEVLGIYGFVAADGE